MDVTRLSRWVVEMADVQITGLNANENPSIIPSCRHGVQFYDSESVLSEALSAHIGLALRQGNSAIVVATESHRKALQQLLRGIDISGAVKEGRYAELDAAEALAEFMVAGVPDKEKFQSTIGALVGRTHALTAPGKELVVFGEMVALLWAEGKRDATVRLEELWNELAELYSFNLLCGYPSQAFAEMEHKQLFFNLCGEHTHVNPAQRSGSGPHLELKSRAFKDAMWHGEERAFLLQKISRAGSWELDITNDLFSFSSAAAKVLGFQSASRLRLVQFLGLMYYSGDRELVFEKLQHAQRHRKEFTVRFRIGNGQESRLIEMQGNVFYNAGSPIMLGVVQDVSPSDKFRIHKSGKMPGTQS